MENLRRCGGPKSAAGCLVSYFVVVAAAADEDIVDGRGSDEQSSRLGTSYGPLGLLERNSARMNGVVPTGCCAGFPCGARGVWVQLYHRLLLLLGSKGGRVSVTAGVVTKIRLSLYINNFYTTSSDTGSQRLCLHPSPSALLVLLHPREDEDEFFYISQAVEFIAWTRRFWALATFLLY